jgi:hypothetical protein
MKPLTREWLEKAEGDFATMERACEKSRMKRLIEFIILTSHNWLRLDL